MTINQLAELLEECAYEEDYCFKNCAGCRYYNEDGDECYLVEAATTMRELKSDRNNLMARLNAKDENVMRIKFLEGAYYPIRAHETDAGLDLRACEDQIIPARGSAVFDVKTCIQLPHGYYGKLESKSGLNVNHGVVSCGGVIDEGYTGSIKVKLYNLSDEDYAVKAGDKICQLIIQPYLAPTLYNVDKLDESDRGDSGFGSTGR